MERKMTLEALDDQTIALRDEANAAEQAAVKIRILLEGKVLARFKSTVHRRDQQQYYLSAKPESRKKG